MTRYTSEQQAVIDCKEKVMTVSSTAGSGKTSTVVGFCEARRDKRILYLVFNASMRKEADMAFKHLPNVTIKTTHGLAYAKFGARYKAKLIMGNYKVLDCVSDLGLSNRDYDFASIVLNCYNKFLVSDLSNISEMVELILGDDCERVKRYSDKLWNMKVNGSISVEHNLYVKLYQMQKYDLGKDYDILAIDEMQDINRCVLDIFNNANCEQKVGVGDSAQSIYAFNGARDALKAIDGHDLKLSNSFRVCQQTADICNKIYSYFLGEDLGMKGLNTNQYVLSVEGLNLATVSKATIICRNNATILGHALEATSRGKTVSFVGGVKGYKFDIYKAAWFFSRTDSSNHFMFKKFESWKDYQKIAKDTDDMEMLSIIGLVKQYNVRIPEGVDLINKRAVTSGGDITLTTAHKSKGSSIDCDAVLLEKDLISLCELKDTMESLELSGVDIAKYMEGVRQELNLLYVALTRCRNGKLYLPKDIVEFLRSV